MLRLGEKQILTVVGIKGFGIYLAEEKGETVRVLLPIKQVPEGCKIGDRLEVFLYRDSMDRMIATTKTPRLLMGQTAVLEVSQVGKIGAFLDWGLEKDLFLPFKEQSKKVAVGEKVLVSLYLDKSERLCATMNVYRSLRFDSPYRVGDQVRGRVYVISDNFGAFVAVDDCYSALIPKKELYGKAEIGEEILARVTQVKEDGRLSLSIREKWYLQIEKDVELIRKLLDSYDGVLPFTDKANPEVIRRETGMSKNEFKKAIGHLLKAGEIQIAERGIRRIP